MAKNDEPKPIGIDPRLTLRWPRNGIQSLTPDELEDFKAHCEEVTKFERGSKWRYPMIPIVQRDPDIAADFEGKFDWQEWFGGIGQFLDQCLVQMPNSEALLDAIEICKWLDSKLSGGEDLTPDLIARAIHLGGVMEWFYSQQFEPLVISAKVSRPGRKKGGTNSAKMTNDEWAKVLDARDLDYTNGLPKAAAARKIGAQLRTGTFRGIGRSVPIEDNTIETKKRPRP